MDERRTDRMQVILGASNQGGAATPVLTVPFEAASDLRKGMALSENRLGALRAAHDRLAAHDRALAYIARRPRSRVEVERYLTRKGVGRSVAAGICDGLVRLGALDDAAFARWWVDNRAAHRPRGRSALRSELAGLGVAREVGAEAVDEVDELAAARRVAASRAERFAYLDHAAFRDKLGAHLARRGFGWEVVREAVEDAWRDVAGRLPDGELAG
jgi:regulatory protein